MKKIITPGVREEAEYVCDVTGKPAVAALVMTFGYGSARDMDVMRVDLSREAAEDVLRCSSRNIPSSSPRKPNPLWNHARFVSGDNLLFRGSCTPRGNRSKQSPSTNRRAR